MSDEEKTRIVYVSGTRDELVAIIDWIELWTKQDAEIQLAHDDRGYYTNFRFVFTSTDETFIMFKLAFPTAIYNIVELKRVLTDV